MVRCSHYPQSPHFLDACDELGLMVWQEPPGWQYVGDAAWQDIVLQNVTDMVIRDRNRPSVIVWGTRLNETANYPGLYDADPAARLPAGRQQADDRRRWTSTPRAGWAEDVFGYDDYHARDGHAELLPPLPGVPYLVSEAVGASTGRRPTAGPTPARCWPSRGCCTPRCTTSPGPTPGTPGLLGWAGFDYASLNGGTRIWRALKTPGVLDTFRAAKPGAAFYRSQLDPRVRPVILPAFFWDFGPGAPPGGPGPHAMIATNCDRLEIYVGGRHVATGTPDRQNLGRLAYPPVFADLTTDGSGLPELRIDGYLGGRLVASVVRCRPTRPRDRLALAADDRSIQADGTDTTRLTFRALDAYGNQRRRVTGEVSLSLTGPATLVGDNPFDLGAYGGVGGAFVRSQPGRAGLVRVTARHPVLGQAAVRITVTAPARGIQFR